MQNEIIIGTVVLMVIGIIVGIICLVACPVVAAVKGRSVIGWLFLGMMLGVIALIIILCLPSENDNRSENNNR